MTNTHLCTIYNKYTYIATKQQELTISISTIDDTNDLEKDVSIYFFYYNFKIEVQV
jgi:hypothetical protein